MLAILLTVFWAEGCPHCEEARPFVEALAAAQPALRVEWVEVRRDDAGRARFRAEVERLGIRGAGVPLFVIGDEAFVGYIQTASMVGIKAMKELGLTGLPVTHVENASATGLVAFRDAAWAVSSGRADVAMALCFDKFTDMQSRGGRGGGRDEIDAPILPASYFALWAQRRMHERGTTREHFAAIAAKNWNYGAVSPMSHRRPDHTVTVELLAPPAPLPTPA